MLRPLIYSKYRSKIPSIFRVKIRYYNACHFFWRFGKLSMFACVLWVVLIWVRVGTFLRFECVLKRGSLLGVFECVLWVRSLSVFFVGRFWMLFLCVLPPSLSVFVRSFVCVLLSAFFECVFYVFFECVSWECSFECVLLKVSFRVFFEGNFCLAGRFFWKGVQKRLCNYIKKVINFIDKKEIFFRLFFVLSLARRGSFLQMCFFFFCVSRPPLFLFFSYFFVTCPFTHTHTPRNATKSQKW